MNRFLIHILVAFVILASVANAAARPNILLAISDDQSFPYASAYRPGSVFTPAFDRVAREGVLFTNAMTASPGCSPSRAAILTGRFPWQNEHAGTHASLFPSKFATYPRLLQRAGYHVGFTGKGWGPGNFRAGGFDENPAGTAFQVASKMTPPGIRRTDYASSFAQFLSERQTDQPFCFWFGSSEPHREFKKGIGLAHGGDPEAVHVPQFLPDTTEVRNDILDYEYEVEWFDTHLGRMLAQLEAIGELDNTIVVVTSDNGMAFPRAKANCYEYGIHVPLAIRWGSCVPPGRKIYDLISLTDLMPTFLDACDILHPQTYAMAGRSMLDTLQSQKQGQVDPQWTQTYAGRERHSSSRWKNFGYPQRCIRTAQFLYIRNYEPSRWPAGAPQKIGMGNYPKSAAQDAQLGPLHHAYHDIDACPTMDLLVNAAGQQPLQRYLELAVSRRPGEELFNIVSDPACLNNLAESADFASTKRKLAMTLETHLRKTDDPRVSNRGEIFESYKRYSGIRHFPKPRQPH